MNTDGRKPPRLAGWLIRRVSNSPSKMSIAGDIEEEFRERAAQSRIASVWLWYMGQLGFVLMSYMFETWYWRIVMFTNYAKTALRNIQKHRGYAFINIVGLAIGMACCILILLYVQFELSYDRYHENAEHIYRLAAEGNMMGRYLKLVSAPDPAAPALMQDYPEVVSATRFRQEDQTLVLYGENKFYEDHWFFTDNETFSMFTFPFIQGDPSRALVDPFTVVLTKETAVRYFGNDDPVGKTLRFGNQHDFLVTGVIENIPAASHFRFDFLASFLTMRQLGYNIDFWGNFNYFTYVQLEEGASPEAFNEKMPAFVQKYLGAFMQQFLGIKMETDLTFYLQPLTDAHLHSDFVFDIAPQSDISYIYIFSGIALFILVIACINFMNLSTARSANRAKEVGLRKVIGGYRSQLVRQFLSETVITALFSLILAAVIVVFSSKYFYAIVEIEMTTAQFFTASFLMGILCIALFVGLLAGLYPAIFLSSFTPSRVLKGSLRAGAKSALFRSVLVVVQFVICITILTGTFIIADQMHYISNKKLGIDREQIVVIPIRDADLTTRTEEIKSELLKHAGILKAAASRHLPGENFNREGFFPEGSQSEEGQIVAHMRVDSDFAPTMGIEIGQGRNFSRAFTTDAETAILVNETAVKHFEWDDPIGKKMTYFIGENQSIDFRVIGVMKDFHFASFHQPIGPLALTIRSSYHENIILKIRSQDIPRTLDFIRTTWHSFSPDYPFDYYFLDAYFNHLYASEIKMRKLFTHFSILAVIIGCLGLFGLAAFSAEQRTKEIGVRKVLGANTGNVLLLLSKEFIRLVLISAVIAWPLAYLLMNRWLENFAYRTGIGLRMFVFSGVLAFGVAIVTVSFQAIKAARTNPAQALKYE